MTLRLLPVVRREVRRQRAVVAGGAQAAGRELVEEPQGRLLGGVAKPPLCKGAVSHQARGAGPCFLLKANLP